MVSRKPRWNALLSRPIPVKDGPLLHTLAQAAKLASTNNPREGLSTWQSAAVKLMKAAETGSADDIHDATETVRLALFLDHRL